MKPYSQIVDRSLSLTHEHTQEHTRERYYTLHAQTQEIDYKRRQQINIPSGIASFTEGR